MIGFPTKDGWYCGRCGTYHAHGTSCPFQFTQGNDYCHLCAICHSWVPYNTVHLCGGTPTPIYAPAAPPGWRCPVCGGGNASWVARCPCVPIPSVPPATDTGTGEPKP